MSNASIRYGKTEAGQLALKARSAQLPARLRPLLILFDGVKTLEQVLTATAGLGVTRDDVGQLVSAGFLAPVQPAEAVTQPAPLPTPDAALDSVLVSTRTPQERYAQAYPIAVKLTSSLGLRGFKLNLAVEQADGYEAMVVLLPKIREAVGESACRELEQALKG